MFINTSHCHVWMLSSLHFPVFFTAQVESGITTICCRCDAFLDSKSLFTEPHNDKAGPQVADKGDSLQIWRWDANV
jgi:hypothetical protein